MNKMLGLLILALAAALSTFPPPASANPLTSPAGTFYTGEIKAESEGATELHGSFEPIKCSKSTIEGKVESHSSTTAGGKVGSLTFSECNYPVKVLSPGSIEIHSSGGDDATATSNGAEITVETSFGGSCIFKTSNTDIGTLTGTDTTASNATLDVGSSIIPRTGHSVFCGSSGTWTGSYKVTTPGSLYID